MLEQLHVYVRGQVQGVGFRYATRSKALRLGLSGWVRNTHDGRVEAAFEGDRTALEQMLAWCRHGPSGAQVIEIEATWTPAQGTFNSFEIRY